MAKIILKTWQPILLSARMKLVIIFLTEMHLLNFLSFLEISLLILQTLSNFENINSYFSLEYELTGTHTLFSQLLLYSYAVFNTSEAQK